MGACAAVARRRPARSTAPCCGTACCARRAIWVGSHTVVDGAERITVSPGGALRVGLGSFGLTSEDDTSVIRVRDGASMHVDGVVSLQRGVRIVVDSGRLTIGHETNVNGLGTKILVADAITIGAGCTFSWDVQLLDNDFHTMTVGGVQQPSTAPIVIGDRVWVGTRAIVLKGVTIGDDAGHRRGRRRDEGRARACRRGRHAGEGDRVRRLLGLADDRSRPPDRCRRTTRSRRLCARLPGDRAAPRRVARPGPTRAHAPRPPHACAAPSSPAGSGAAPAAVRPARNRRRPAPPPAPRPSPRRRTCRHRRLPREMT